MAKVVRIPSRHAHLLSGVLRSFARGRHRCVIDLLPRGPGSRFAGAAEVPGLRDRAHQIAGVVPYACDLLNAAALSRCGRIEGESVGGPGEGHRTRGQTRAGRRRPRASKSRTQCLERHIARMRYAARPAAWRSRCSIESRRGSAARAGYKYRFRGRALLNSHSAPELHVSCPRSCLVPVEQERRGCRATPNGEGESRGPARDRLQKPSTAPDGL